jgi:hypothetical protein
MKRKYLLTFANGFLNKKFTVGKIKRVFDTNKNRGFIVCISDIRQYEPKKMKTLYTFYV